MSPGTGRNPVARFTVPQLSQAQGVSARTAVIDIVTGASAGKKKVSSLRRRPGRRFQSPPINVSSPSPPKIVSAPPPPRSTSAPSAPVSVSLAAAAEDRVTGAGGRDDCRRRGKRVPLPTCGRQRQGVVCVGEGSDDEAVAPARVRNWSNFREARWAGGNNTNMVLAGLKRVRDLEICRYGVRPVGTEEDTFRGVADESVIGRNGAVGRQVDLETRRIAGTGACILHVELQ